MNTIDGNITFDIAVGKFQMISYVFHLGSQLILWAILISSVKEYSVNGFNVQRLLPSRKQNRINGRGSSNTRVVLDAKKPPTQGVDLEEIEAFESRLEELEQGNDVSEEDDLDFDYVEPSADVRIVTIPSEIHNKRIDAALAELLEPSISRSICGHLVTDGRVSCISSEDGLEVKSEELIDRKSFRVEKDMILKVSLPVEEKPNEIVAQNLALDILFEDEHMIVLNKAANMVVHPAAGNWDGTVVNGLAYYLPRSTLGRGDFLDAEGRAMASGNSKVMLEDGQAIEESQTVSFRPGIVHRLDKGTTGCLVVAKTSQALTALSEAFAARQVKKTYLAVTVGNPGQNIKIDKPIGRHPIHRQRMRVVPDPHQKNSRFRKMTPKDLVLKDRPPSQAGRRALSFVDTLAFDGKLALVRVKIETGRTHQVGTSFYLRMSLTFALSILIIVANGIILQIRVHLQDRHTPIYGDNVYGLSDWNKRLLKMHQIDHPLLHAYKLQLKHPITGEVMHFTAPMDPDMERIATTVVPPGSEQELSELLDWD